MTTLTNQVIPDATWAMNDANAQQPQDQIAAQCYQSVLTFSNTVVGRIGQLPSLPTGVHVISDFQIARDLSKGASNGIPQTLVLGCAALAQDTRTDITTLLSKIMGQATVGFITANPGLLALVP